jgi:uncharacterized protein YqhQ
MANEKPFYYGGQALIEGVMMRGREHMAMAVRKPDGELEIISEPLSSIYKGRLRETPFIRGIIVLMETLALGIRTMLRSAQIATAEEGEEDIPPAALWGSVALAVVFAVAVFFIGPLLLTHYTVDPFITSSVVSNLIEGLIRIAIFIAYLKLIGLMPDIKRVFSYHGAEHKVVNAYEEGEPLELENVRKYSTAHARCGTSFTLAVLVLAIIVFALLGRPNIWISIASRIVLIPVIAAIGYEFVRYGGTHSKNPFVRVTLGPGLWLQSMTTREPDDSQMEAALSALIKVVEADSGELVLEPPSLGPLHQVREE